MEEIGKKDAKYRFCGQFHLGERYDINDWMTMSTCCIHFLLIFIIAVFQCHEIVNGDTNPKLLYMVISESAFLLLAPEEKRKNLCTLTLWSTLQTLAKIERDFDAPNKIIFYWHRPSKRVSNRACKMNRKYLNKS